MSADIRLALDSNLLVCAEGANGADRKAAALGILRDLRESEVIVPVQALGELFAVLTRKAKWPAAEARNAVLAWTDAYPVADATPAVMLEAMEIVTTHHLALRDAMLLAVAARAGCRLVLSQDMKHGFTWRRVTVQDPFTTEPIPTPKR